MPQVGGPEREERQRRRANQRERARVAAQRHALDAASAVDRLALLDGRLDQPPDQRFRVR